MPSLNKKFIILSEIKNNLTIFYIIIFRNFNSEIIFTIAIDDKAKIAYFQSLDNIGEAYDKGGNAQARFHALIYNK